MTLPVDALRRRGHAANPRALRARNLPVLIALALLAGGIPTLSAPAPAAAANCFSSLQSRIDSTAAGGTLTVPPCVYKESITLRRSIPRRKRAGWPPCPSSAGSGTRS